MTTHATPTAKQIYTIAGRTGLDPRTIRRVYGLRRDGRVARPITRDVVAQIASEIGAPPPPPEQESAA